jgi:hypothetical protein
MGVTYTNLYKGWGHYIPKMAYVCRATYKFDVQSQTDAVEIEFTEYSKKKGWRTYVDLVETYPEGDWTEINFGPDNYVPYEDFLNTMVHKNVGVCRKIAKLSLDNVSTKNPRRLFRIMNAIKILDPTFQPPIINTDCAWQLNLLRDIALDTSYQVIATCINKKRLKRYFKVSRLF